LVFYLESKAEEPTGEVVWVLVSVSLVVPVKDRFELVVVVLETVISLNASDDDIKDLLFGNMKYL
jgi:hypothetical protein